MGWLSHARTKGVSSWSSPASDFWDDLLDLARNHKHYKVGYVALQSELCKSLPNCTVELLTFVLGDSRMFYQALWTHHLDCLGLPGSYYSGFFDIAVSGAYEPVARVWEQATWLAQHTRATHNDDCEMPVGGEDQGEAALSDGNGGPPGRKRVEEDD
eukprot:2156889-Rhodomonas_salina.1